MDKDLLALLMDFSGVDDPTKVTTIWRKWQHTKQFGRIAGI